MVGHIVVIEWKGAEAGNEASPNWPHCWGALEAHHECENGERSPPWVHWAQQQRTQIIRHRRLKCCRRWLLLSICTLRSLIERLLCGLQSFHAACTASMARLPRCTSHWLTAAYSRGVVHLNHICISESIRKDAISLLQLGKGYFAGSLLVASPLGHSKSATFWAIHARTFTRYIL